MDGASIPAIEIAQKIAYTALFGVRLQRSTTSTARLINASRGAIVDEKALISVLTTKHIAMTEEDSDQKARR
jgi:lactate dehydrogenase-like 2-hydroxyacid dehydrogenase